MLAEEAVDVTLPWDRRPRGARHPLTTLADRIADVFVAMGYEVAEGPEVEAEWFNFDALNFGKDHPARAAHGHLLRRRRRRGDSGLLLRTHTSPVQARVLLEREPAGLRGGARARPSAPTSWTPPTPRSSTRSRAWRSTRASPWRTCAARWTTSPRAMFGAGLRTRFRPHFFPFTEPSAEFDVQCWVCRGASVGDPARPCRTCKSEGFVEWGGCGMVNPRVLVACGVDPERYSGFAFGMGIERTLMARHDAEDMRDMVEGDVRFTLPFGMEV